MVKIVEAGPDSFPQVLAIWNSVWPEYATDKEEMRHRDSLDATLRPRYWLAQKDESPIGLLEISSINGSYHPQRWTINVAVEGKSRRRGVGKALYDFGLAHIAPSNPLSVVTHVREGDEVSIRFAESRQFVEVKRDFISELRLHDIDAELVSELMSRSLPTSVRIVSGIDVDSPDFRIRLHRLFEEVRKDIPRSFPPTAMTFEQFEAGFLDPQLDWKCSMFAMKGTEPVGFSVGFVGPTKGRMMQGLTAVSREYRGMGVAKCLKAHFANKCKLAGYEVIATDNDTRNQPMLAINNQFGFQRLPATIHYLWSTDGS